MRGIRVFTFAGMLLTLSVFLTLSAYGNYAFYHEESGRSGESIQAGIIPQPENIVYQRMQWYIDPAVRYIRGAITSVFIPSSGDYETFILDLSDSLSVDSVKRGNVHLTFSHNLSKLSISTGLIAEGTMDSVTIFYQGSPGLTGFGSFETTVTPAGNPIMWTLSEPYGCKDWWPCKQDSRDKTDSCDIFITVPEGNKAASNGVLVSGISDGNNITYHWKHRHPIAAYLVAMAVTNYVEFTNLVTTVHGELQVLNYVYPESLEQWQFEAEEIHNVLPFFDSLLIPYPFFDEKYGHAQFGWGGGMEHQTMSFMGGLNASLMAHELAHQWFGDFITCGSWSDIWLNEGFATYMTGLYFERFQYQNWIGWKIAQRVQVTSASDGSVYVYDTTETGRIFDGRLTYAKGACVLHMLRETIGDESFFRAIRNYLSDPDLKDNYSLTPDLMRHFEQETGMELGYYFDQWVMKEGFPRIRISWQQPSDLLSVNITQSPSHVSVEKFITKVPLTLFGKNGIRDTVRISLNDLSQVNYYYPGFQVDSIAADPDYDFLALYEITKLSPDDPGDIRIFPNPASVSATLLFSKPEIYPSSVRVFDVCGREVDASIMSGSVSAGMDLAFPAAVANGVYYIHLNFRELIKVIPMVVSN